MNKEEHNSKKKHYWWKDIRDEVAGSIIFESALNGLLWIPRAIFRLLRNW